MLRQVMSSKVILDEKIIECVRKHEVLYNTDLKDYSDNNFKLEIWNQIAKDCGLSSGDDAKKHWKSLRDGYRSALKTYKKTSKTHPMKKIKKWKYFEKMKFVRPHIKERHNNLDTNSEISEESFLFDETSEDQRHSDIIKEETEHFEIFNFNEDEFEECQSEESPASKKLCLSTRNRIDPEEMSRGTQWNQLHQSHMFEDGLKLFFDSMYASAKKLPPALQRVVKNKLLQAINEAEIQMETQQ